MENIYDETLAELKAYNQGDKSRIARVRTREYTPVTPIKAFTGEEIKNVRERNNFSQSYFGDFLGVSLKTIQAWEAETNKPSGSALRVLQILEQNPNALDEYILVKA